MIAAAQLLAFAPRADAAHAPLIDAAAQAWRVTTPLRMAHWMAQISVESAELTRFEENLAYSAPRIVAVWPRRFTLAMAETLAGNPEALANAVYAGRMGNGDAASGDGWRFRGRGPLMETGRAAYAKLGELLDLPLEAGPDLLADPAHGYAAAGAYWASLDINAAADRDDLMQVTRLVNGGLTDLGLRQQALTRAKQIWR